MNKIISSILEGNNCQEEIKIKQERKGRSSGGKSDFMWVVRADCTEEVYSSKDLRTTWVLGISV